VTAITESQNLATMTMAALFGKLREHELELGRLNEEEDIGRKKNIAFKTKVVKDKKQKEEEDSDDDENLSLMIKKFTKFMKAKGKNQFKSNKKDNQGHPQISNAMDVDNLDTSKLIQRKVKKRRAENSLKRKHT